MSIPQLPGRHGTQAYFADEVQRPRKEEGVVREGPTRTSDLLDHLASPCSNTGKTLGGRAAHGTRVWVGVNQPPSQCGLAETEGPRRASEPTPCHSLLAWLSTSIFIPVMAWLPGRVWCLLSTVPGAIAEVESGLCAELHDPTAPGAACHLAGATQPPQFVGKTLGVVVLTLNPSFPNKQGC